MVNTSLKRYIEHIELEVTNIGIFREFRIDLTSGAVTEISGDNGLGKTTLLKALKYNTSGGRCKVPDDLVHDGEQRGQITAKLDGMTVERDINLGETATDLSLTDQDGTPMKRKSPAALLEEMLGDGQHLSPMDLIAMRPDQRAKAIVMALDVNPTLAASLLQEITGKAWPIKGRDDLFAVLQQARESVAEQRRATREKKEAADMQADGVLGFLPVVWREAAGESDLPAKPVVPEPLGDIYDKKRAVEVKNAERARVGDEIAELEALIRQHEETIAGHDLSASRLDESLLALGATEDEAALEEQIRQLQQQLADMRDRNMRRRQLYLQSDGARKSAHSLRETLAQHRLRLDAKQARERELGGAEDVSALQERIDAHEQRMAEYQSAVEVHGDYYSRWRQSDALRQSAKDLQTAWEQLQWQVEAIDRLPIKLLEGVPLPIPGMQFFGKDGADLYLPDGDALRKFDAFGDADQMRYAARLAMELAPINLLILDGVERCGKSRRLELYRMAAEAGFIVLSTRVTDDQRLIVSHFTADTLTADAPPPSGPDWGEDPTTDQPTLFTE
jgi:hypothetical protein